VTLTTNLSAAPGSSHAIYALLVKLAEAIDEGGASYVQLMAKVVVPKDAVDSVEQAAKAAQANVNTRELPS
jgi:hypothetical protein